MTTIIASPINTLVFYAENIEPEACLPALLQMIRGVQCYGVKPQDATLQVAESLMVFAHLQSVVMLGNYFEPVLEELAKNHQAIKFYMFSFGKCHPINHDNVRIEFMSQLVGDERQGPVETVLRYVKELGSADPLFFTVVNYNKRLLGLIEDRALERNAAETEPFFSGFYNYKFQAGQVSALERFTELLTNPQLLDDVIKCGHNSIAMSIRMATERATKNSCSVTLPNGMTASITTAPELVNQTHQALVQKHRTDVTITTNLEYGNAGVRVFFSVRSNNSAFDAEAFTRQLDLASGGGNNPGGNPKGAGVRVPLTNVPAFESIFSKKHF